MGEFFKSWRRKIGAVTLVVACVFMGAWGRSLGVEDCFVFPISGGESGCFLSVNGSFGFSIILDRRGFLWGAYPLSPPSFDLEGYVITRCGVKTGGRIKNWVPFEIDPCPYVPAVQFPHIPPFISYWFVIAPLTLFSAYLLFFSTICDYFHRWRQTMGIATLVLTLLFTGWWVRSLVVHDCIYFEEFVKADVARYLVYPNVYRRIVGVATDSQSLVWLTYSNHKQIAPTPYPSVNFPSGAKQSEQVGNVDLSNDPSTAELPALSTAIVPLKFIVVPFLVIPFWYIVTPLALLSAFFLLLKPHKSNQEKITEPIMDEGK